MTDRMPLAHTSRTFRNVWLIAGGLLIVSGILAMLQSPLFGTPVTTYVYGTAGTLLYSVGGVLFALGFRREASVTARRRLGTWALIALVVVLPIVRTFVWGSVSIDFYKSGMIYVLILLDLCVELAIALIVAISIVLAKVVPRPWRWAPLIAVAISAIAEIIRVITGAASNIPGSDVMSEVAGLVSPLMVAVLGVIAVVLALTRRTTTQ